MPSPPPPYSPNQPNIAQHVGPSSSIQHGTGFAASPPAEVLIRNSPQVTVSATFPPPPAQASSSRDRSASGMGGARSFFALSGMRGKQPVTQDAQMYHGGHIGQTPLIIDVRPPTARRAASTGQLSAHSEAASVADWSERSSPGNGWQPGMPLPPPPPRPTPRAQSVDRYPSTASSNANSWTSEHTIEHVAKSIGKRRAAAVGVSLLSPIPPTPANWVDDDAQEQQTGSSRRENTAEYQPLRIDTGAHADSPLTRRPAKRNSSQGIRERRSRSRKARESRHGIVGEALSPTSEYSRPSGSDIISSPESGLISRRREHMRTISGYVETSGEHAIAKPSAEIVQAQPKVEAATHMMTPPYTPAINSRDSEGKRKSATMKTPLSAGSNRPSPHLQRTQNDDTTVPTPLSPARPQSASSNKPSARLDAFALQALERHRMFIEKEATSTSDGERLELFANFMVHESRLRRDRYQAAYTAMASDVVDLTRDMWRSYTRQSKRAVTPSTSMSSCDPTVPSWASDGQPMSAHGGMPSSASSFGDFTPATDFGSMGDAAEALERSASRMWKDEYKPSLSPIPSMAVSTVPDEGSSRGRTQSRWWEPSNSGSGSIGKPDRIEKSRRETKYMGVTAASLQQPEQSSPALSRHTPTPGASTAPPGYGEDEYPPEKVGWHEGVDTDTPMATPHHQRERKASTPGFDPLDVSRLVTLPPPFPRHYPAVNNKHPMLTELRGAYRTLADHSEIQRIKDVYLDKDFAIQRADSEQAKKRRSDLRSKIQSQVADGSISYADAAKAEADFDVEEAKRGKANARSNFDVFESSVANPLNNLLTERIQLANTCINELRSEVESRNQTSDPNHAQEEGDEEPERLEKLTLLKWFFEAREQLHKEMCELHAQRSEKYSEVILTPYRISKLQAKIDEATAFFSKDSRERQATFAKESVKRYNELQNVIERSVSRGVEDQLSAFWDIAPSLLEVIQHIPLHSLDGDFEVQIPPTEYDENPPYHHHPLQYLYSLLSHAEKSAYQFIESQTNLLCLLHEVRTGAAKSSLKLMEVERISACPPNGDELKDEMEESRRLEEERLTADLKEKVGEVERQWKEALGDGIEECKGRVRAWLEASGGWDEGLEG